jgi:hypothetical protein
MRDKLALLKTMAKSVRWLASSDLRARAQLLQERHAEALKLNRWRISAPKGERQVPVNEVQVRSAFYVTRNDVGTAIV